MKTVLITGANRGIGLEFVKQYLQEGARVLATCRDPQKAKALTALKEMGDLQVAALDVTQPEQVDAAAERWRDQKIDLLLNNAGVYGPRNSFGANDIEADMAAWETVFRVNTMAPLRVALAFQNQVAAAKGTMAFITSKMGSIADNTSGGSIIYRTSKSALNMTVKSLSIDLAPRGISCVLFHPGWVLTDMGGPNALIDVTTSVGGMRAKIDQLTTKDRGKYFNYDGREIPW
ncbi:SDR family oxidoreductase [Acanthopleuribacter pedis]|uniref:SDR family oxidoreductase n=1 Tax=Acanthopleuribacter pedis TaxID=442870 RepID=A0A8J7U3W2_9BACT|nr:SDR family oxidoreductase [Acanthopleuribacter pedis]MBO1318733.1 SDR family oxidoreductase [Acanthopleuribacter pedis]